MSKALSGNDARMSFWEHLDILRATLIWIVVVWCLFSVVVFTLLLVSLPIWLLYETSIFLARYVEKGRLDETSDLGLTK